MVQGRIVDANGEKMELELDMSSTFTARFRCEDPSGKPVKGVNVSVYANQQYLNGGNTLLGARHRSIESIQSQIEGKLTSGEVKDWTFFSGASGEDGVLEIKGLPRTQSNFSANIVPPMHSTPYIESFPAPSVEQSISEQTIRISP